MEDHFVKGRLQGTRKAKLTSPGYGKYDLKVEFMCQKNSMCQEILLPSQVGKKQVMPSTNFAILTNLRVMVFIEALTLMIFVGMMQQQNFKVSSTQPKHCQSKYKKHNLTSYKFMTETSSIF